MTINAVVIPRWGMEMTEGTITAWLVEEGASVEVGDEIAEIETTKIANVLESPFAGKLRRIVETAGTTVPSGGLIGVIADDGASDSDVEAFAKSFQPAEAEADDTASPVSDFVDLELGRIHVMRGGGGDREATVLVHGYGADLSTWAFNTGALNERVDITAIDLPGHGDSSKSVGEDPLATLADAIGETCRALDLDKAHLIGHSMGGLCCLRLAETEPGLVRSLSLLAPAGIGPSINTDFLLGLAEASRRKELRAVLETLVSNPDNVTLKMVNDVLRYRRLDGVTESLALLREALVSVNRDDEIGRLAGLSCPAQVIWGSEDRVTPAPQPSELPDRVALNIVDGAGHLAHMEKANAVNGLLLDFLSS